MKYLTLDLVKNHLNVDSWNHSDDDYITALCDTAEQMVAAHLDTDLENILLSDGSLPAPVRQAMLLLIGNLYQNREGIAFSTVNDIPHSYDYLLQGFKNYTTSQL